MKQLDNNAVALQTHRTPVSNVDIPGDKWIRAELLSQSRLLFGRIGLGGYLGPTKHQYDRYRPSGWPHSRTLLGAYHLTKDATGWAQLLEMFGLVPPTNADIQHAAWRKDSDQSKRTTNTVDAFMSA